VELADVDQIFENPLHPYTKALLSAVPVPNPKVKSKRVVLTGDVPSPLNPPLGCRFHPRCREKKAMCSSDEPQLVDFGKEHFVACHPE